jgi:hypothetical protein
MLRKQKSMDKITENKSHGKGYSFDTGEDESNTDDVDDDDANDKDDDDDDQTSPLG